MLINLKVRLISYKLNQLQLLIFNRFCIAEGRARDLRESNDEIRKLLVELRSLKKTEKLLREKTIRYKKILTAKMLAQPPQRTLSQEVINRVTRTFAHLIDSPLPKFVDATDNHPKYSRVFQMRIPDEVIGWPGFEKLVEASRANIPPEVLAISELEPMGKPKGEGGDEAALTGAFITSAGDALDQLFFNSILTYPTSYSGFGRNEKQRLPDFVCTRECSNDAMRGMWLRQSLRRLMAIGETKRTNLIRNGEIDLVKSFVDGKKDVESVVQQVVGSMCHYRCRYGFLTVYEATYAFRLQDRNVYVSPPYLWNVSGSQSTLNMMYAVLNMACSEWGEGPNPWTPPDLPYKIIKATVHASKGVAGSEVVTESNSSCDAVMQDGMTCKILQLVSDNKDRVTWQAEISNFANRSVAIKAYEDIHNRNLEVACYDALKPLQGSSIPELLDVVEILIEDDPCKYGLVLSWMDIQDDASMKVPASSLLQAREIVKTMHIHGVAHGDIKLANMNFDPNTHTVQIFDFSHAYLESDFSAAEFRQACVQDLESLDEIVLELRANLRLDE
jgi:hypothetical protein